MAAEKEVNLEPESITHNVNMGIHHGVRAYLAAYNSSQASRVGNLQLRETLTEDNPYMEVLIPQVDLELDLENMSQREIQACYESELDKSDVVIVVLEGVESEAWTGFECVLPGLAASMCTVLRRNRPQGAESTSFRSHVRRIDHLQRSDDITRTHTEISHALATRVMVQNQ